MRKLNALDEATGRHFEEQTVGIVLPTFGQSNADRSSPLIPPPLATGGRDLFRPLLF